MEGLYHPRGDKQFKNWDNGGPWDRATRPYSAAARQIAALRSSHPLLSASLLLGFEKSLVPLFTELKK